MSSEQNDDITASCFRVDKISSQELKRQDMRAGREAGASQTEQTLARRYDKMHE